MFKWSVTLYQFFKLAKIQWNYLTLISGRFVILRDLFGMPEGSSRNSALLRQFRAPLSPFRLHYLLFLTAWFFVSVPKRTSCKRRWTEGVNSWGRAVYEIISLFWCYAALKGSYRHFGTTYCPIFKDQAFQEVPKRRYLTTNHRCLTFRKSEDLKRLAVAL